MSWHFLQEQEEASWEGSSLDGAPSALLRLIPTAVESCSPGNVTGYSLNSQSGMKCVPSTGTPGVGTSTLSRAASPARTSAAQAVAQGSLALEAGYGSSSSASSGKSGRRKSSSRTHPGSALAVWVESSRGLPASGMMRDGACWELMPLAPPTSENGSGFVPTCAARDWRSGKSNLHGRNARPPNEVWVACLPTPTTRGNEMAAPMQKWPAHRRMRELMGRILPTPTAQLYGNNRGGAAGRVGPVRQSLEGLTGGPWISFREWMMGFPIGWTALRPLETHRFREWLRWHGGYWPGVKND